MDVLFFSGETNEVVDWKKAENNYGIVLPDDYKKFIEKHGAGSINDFFWIYSPFCPNPFLNLFQKYEKVKYAYGVLKEEFPQDFIYDFYDNGKGLFPWAGTEDGDDFYWYYSEENIEIIVYASEYNEYKVFQMGTCEFLYNLLSKKIKCDFLAEDFIKRKNIFTSYSEKQIK